MLDNYALLIAAGLRRLAFPNETDAERIAGARADLAAIVLDDAEAAIAAGEIHPSDTAENMRALAAERADKIAPGRPK